MVSIYGGSGGGGFDYVQDPAPQDPKEGEEWYDTGANAAYVYDGANWIKQTVVDHGELSGVGSSDHHSRPTSTQAQGDRIKATTVGGTYTENSNLSGGSSTIASLTWDFPIMSDQVEVSNNEGGTLTWIEVRNLDGTWNRVDSFSFTDSRTVGFGSQLIVGIRTRHKNDSGDVIDTSVKMVPWVEWAGLHSHPI